MRMLVSSSPGLGHLLPLLPVARAARDAGHDVLVATGAGLAPVVTSAGFQHAPVGPATLGEVLRTIPDVGRLTGRRLAVTIFRNAFCGDVAAHIADDVLALAAGWRPDIIVHEDLELGSWVVAERLGIPHATVQATAWRPHMRELAGEPLNALRARHGLRPDPELAGLYGGAFFTTRPPSLRDPGAPLPEVTAELRPIADDRHAGADHDLTDDGRFEPTEGPRIAVTLGTVNAGQQALLQTIVEGAAAVGGRVTVALGADPATLGPVPRGVDVRAYIPMSTLLPTADVVAFHGGSGTMLAALAAGRPLVIVPIAADQLDNADLCLAAGVARVLEREGLQAEAVRRAIETVLSDPAYARRAGEIAEEIAGMPGPETALARLEGLVGRGRATGSRPATLSP